jgi:hypothetical protein
MLFFPIINAECSDTESPPFYGPTPEARRACAKAIVDGASDLNVTVDGVSLHNLQRYRVASPDFAFGAAPGNSAGVPAGFGHASGNGYYVMIAPLLREGTYRIRVTGFYPVFGFAIDTTFVITARR